jgi:hypothetical protein
VVTDQYGTSYSPAAYAFVRPPATFAFSGSAFAIAGGTSDTTVSLGALLPADHGLSSPISWSLLPGQNLPLSISVTSSGTLTGRAPANAGSGSLNVYVKAQGADTTSLIGKVTIDLFGFGAQFVVNSGTATPTALDLNANLPSGVASANWAWESADQQFAPGLLHRWSFNENGGTLLRDSAGNLSGVLVTPLMNAGSLQSATIGSGSVSLGGGSYGFASFLQMPSGRPSASETESP